MEVVLEPTADSFLKAMEGARMAPLAYSLVLMNRFVLMVKPPVRSWSEIEAYPLRQAYVEREERTHDEVDV